MSAPCWGIDLGTTTSAIGRVRRGVPEVVAIEGDPLLPSVVYFPVDGPPEVGHRALNRLPLEPGRTIHSAKRQMGTEHTWELGDRVVTPVDVSAAILRALVDGAEAATGERPTRAVITVPAWFTQAQRADTRRAGELAGLEVARVINEPTAAALAHAHGADAHRRVLVYDLGGGTFDVSLVRQDGPVVEVLASHGDSLLGGDDIDEALGALVLDRLAAEDPALVAAIRASQAARVRLRLAVEQAKIALSREATATLRAPWVVDVDGEPRHLAMPLERADLDAAVMPFVERTLASVDRVLADAATPPSAIDELLLVGGSTLLPEVWWSLHHRYGLEGSRAVDPRRAVVLGAAIQGAILDGAQVDGVLLDVAPYSLSIGAAAGGLPGFPVRFVCEVITPRNAPLPSRHTHVVHTNYPGQASITIPVYQGAHPDPRRNTLLGEIFMDGLGPPPEGELTRPIAVALRHDLDGMVDIRVVDQLSGREVSGRVAADGAEQAALREAWERRIIGWNLIFGEGDTPSAREASPGRTADAPPLTGMSSVDAEEAEATFDQVLGAEVTLRADHPSAADDLLARARAGREALAAGDGAAAREHHEALADRLFEEGIYL